MARTKLWALNIICPQRPGWLHLVSTKVFTMIWIPIPQNHYVKVLILNDKVLGEKASAIWSGWLIPLEWNTAFTQAVQTPPLASASLPSGPLPEVTPHVHQKVAPLHQTWRCLDLGLQYYEKTFLMYKPCCLYNFPIAAWMHQGSSLGRRGP